MSQPDYTIDEIRAELGRLRDRVGAKAYVDVTVSVGSFQRANVVAVIYPTGVGTGGGRLHSDGRDFREALTKLEAVWDEHQNTYTTDAIRRMALAIISTTMDLGSCSDAALRGQDFSQDEIDRLGARACDVANEMAGKGPFEIVTHGAAANAEAA
jgi:hypothetical protein